MKGLIICNDFPKCGVHALAKACGLLGVPAMLTHLTYAQKNEVPDYTKHLFIVRDLRNALISRLRMDGKGTSSGQIIARIKEYEKESGVSFYDNAKQYEPWLTGKRAFIVRFEDLIKDDKEIRRIAEHLCVPYLADAFDNLEGMTYTWTGKYTVWQDYWTDDIETVWKEYKCDELNKRFGYE